MKLNTETDDQSLSLSFCIFLVVKVEVSRVQNCTITGHWEAIVAHAGKLGLVFALQFFLVECMMTEILKSSGNSFLIQTTVRRKIRVQCVVMNHVLCWCSSQRTWRGRNLATLLFWDLGYHLHLPLQDNGSSFIFA